MKCRCNVEHGNNESNRNDLVQYTHSVLAHPTEYQVDGKYTHNVSGLPTEYQVDGKVHTQCVGALYRVPRRWQSTHTMCWRALQSTKSTAKYTHDVLAHSTEYQVDGKVIVHPSMITTGRIFD